MSRLQFEDLAATPPLTLSASAPLAEARRLFALSGAEALVVEHEDGAFAGLLERRVLEKALSFGLEERVGGLCDPEAPVFEACTEVDEETLSSALRSPSSYAVILQKGKPVGVFSPGEVLAWGLCCPAPPPLDLASFRDLRAILSAAREEAEDLGVTVFLVGGGVRDRLLGKEVFDLDLVVSRRAEELAQGLARRLSGELKARSLFGTYKVALPGGQEIDVAQSRWEYYEAPAVLPRVAPGPLREDLFRRDFTINALALALNGPLAGRVVDLFGGMRDLAYHHLRIHHTLSLVDDPTRIFRASRYLVRFGLTPGRAFFVSLDLVHRYRVFEALSPARLRRELERILEEPFPPEVFSKLFAFGVFDDICGADTSSVEGEIRELWSLAQGLRLRERDLLEALVLLFQRVSPSWQRLLDFPPGRAERLVEDLLFLEEKVPVLSSETRRSRQVALLEKVSPPAILVFAVRFPLAKGLVREYFLRLKDLRPTISGQDLLAAGLSPGPEIGRILKRLREAWLDGEISSPEEERAWLKKEFPHVFS